MSLHYLQKFIHNKYFVVLLSSLSVTQYCRRSTVGKHTETPDREIDRMEVWNQSVTSPENNHLDKNSPSLTQ